MKADGNGKLAPLNIAVFGSGTGSNYGAIASAIEEGRLHARVALVVSDNAESGILRLAAKFGAPARCLAGSRFKTRLEPEIERDLADDLLSREVELVVLAGYMRVVKAPLLDVFPRRIINIHPSLLPKFPGLEAWRQALEAGETETGCTVHYVDPGIDTGEIIAQERVPVLPGDGPESLHARIHAAEHRLYPRVIGDLAAARAAAPKTK